MISALFVASGGHYYGISGVDPWDIERDARKYAGPNPVVAHPPCARWCQLAGLVEARYGYKKCQDDGCFASALASVRAFGGVLEHPAYSMAWAHFGLDRPGARGWMRTSCGGWVAQVDQGHYGHAARKRTWLYVYGVPSNQLPELLWGPAQSTALVSFCKNHTRSDEHRRRLSRKESSATPPAFRDLLIQIAHSVEMTQ